MIVLIIFVRLVCLVVLLVGWSMTTSSTGWVRLLGFVVFLVGIELFDRSCIWENDHRKMPYRWDCKICRRKGKPSGMRASDKRVIDSWRADHNRTVHLMEP